MTRHLTTSLTAGLLFAAACAEPPTAARLNGPEVSLSASTSAYVPGEQQPVALFTQAGYFLYPEGAGQNLSQTFTPTEGQWLGYLRLPVSCAPGVLLNVKIRYGLGGAILYESNLPVPVVLEGAFRRLQVFDPVVSPRGIRLNRGQSYAFELAALPGPGGVYTTCIMAAGPSGNSYAGGLGYYRDPINGPSWVPLSSGLPADPDDLPFITLVIR